MTNENIVCKRYELINECNDVKWIMMHGCVDDRSVLIDVKSLRDKLDTIEKLASEALEIMALEEDY